MDKIIELISAESLYSSWIFFSNLGIS